MQEFQEDTSRYLFSNGVFAMNPQKTLSLAESIDRKIRLMAGAMFLYSLGIACEAMQLVVSPQAANLMDKLSLGLMLGAFSLGLHLVWWKTRNVPKDQHHLLSDPDGFVAEVIKRSCSISWAWTIVFLMLLGLFSKNVGTDLPLEFFTKLGVFLMLCVFSLSFFHLFRSHPEEEPADSRDV